MTNPFPYSLDNKRYHTLTYHYQQVFHKKLYKAVLDAGFSCPHIVNGTGGCTFCSIRGSGDFALSASVSLKQQYQKQKQIMQKKWPQAEPIAYFQAYSNTYASLDALKLIYDPFFTDEYDNVAVAIGTRADCLSDSTLDYLHQQSFKKPVYLEIGVQSIHPLTNQIINRGHDLDIVERVLKKCKDKNVHIVLHIINGLPYETRTMMIETARWIASQPISGIKIHMLHLLKGTSMAKEYLDQPFDLLTMDAFVDVVIAQLEVLPPTMVIHRITGDALADDLIAPVWTRKKRVVLNTIDKQMAKINTYQGKYNETY